MARAKLKSWDDISRISVKIGVNSPEGEARFHVHPNSYCPYYHIWYSNTQKIGFRAPYKSYLGTEVEVIKKTNRKGRIIPDIYTVYSRGGKPIFIAHISWFEYIEYDKPELNSSLQEIYDIARLEIKSIVCKYNRDELNPEPEPVLPDFSELTWNELFDM